MKYLRGDKINHIDIAEDFYVAYLRCFEPNSENKIVAIPGFANGFFACELYLKVLTDNRKKFSHNLKDLIMDLDENLKKELEEIYNKNKKILELAGSFEDFLDKTSNGFIFWRYIYEEDNKDFENKYPFLYSKEFLNMFLPKLKQMSENYILNKCEKTKKD